MKRPNGPRNLKAGGFTDARWRFDEQDKQKAAGIIRRCEADLNRQLSRGEMRDLLKDNTRWDSAKVHLIVALLFPERGFTS